MSENAQQFNDEEARGVTDWQDAILSGLDAHRPVLLVGPTASGKSALAMRIAERQGGTIVNADALQVFSNWRILTARPTEEHEARFPHRLYGHVPGDHRYSVGDWLRDAAPHLSGGPRTIIAGGTGLYFTALTEGLAKIPPTPPDIRMEADRRISAEGARALLAEIDPNTVARIDRKNPARIQRAWEVQATTGQGLAAWHSETAAPIMPLSESQPILLEADRAWLAARIASRFKAMLEAGVLDEARQNRATWSPKDPSSKAIGAAELMSYLDGAISLDTLEARVTTLSRQYAKRQRTWFGARMRRWTRVRCH